MIKIYKQYPVIDAPTKISVSPYLIEFEFAGHLETLNFADLKKRADFVDFTHYGVDMHPPAISQLPKPKQPIVSLYAHTVDTKLRPGEFAAVLSNKLNMLIHVFVPSASAESFDDCLLCFVTTGKVEANFKYEELKTTANGLFPDRPSLKISGPAVMSPDSTNEFSLTYVDGAGKIIKSDVEVYLDTVAGFLPKRRVTLKAGKGTFRLKSLGLDFGDEIRVKAGFKNFSGLAEFTVTCN